MDEEEIVKTFTAPLEELKELDELWRQRKKSGVLQISGCIDAAKPHMIYGMGNGSGNRIIADRKSVV